MHATGSLSSIFCLLCWHLLVYTEFDVQAVSLEETPIDTVTVVGRDAQLNCSFRNLGSETPTWKIEENTRPVKVTSNFTILRPGYSLIGEASIGGYQEYHLLMMNVPLDFGGTYTCTLLGPPGLQHSADAELKVLENGPICGINPGPAVVSDENESVFSCHINGDLLGDLVWFKNGKEILRGNSSSLEYSTTLQKGDNGAVYNCQYENRDIPSDLWPQLTCVDDIIVDVQYPATVAVTNKTIGPVLEGDKVFALCQITEDGNPEVLHDFYWLGPDGRRANDGLLLIDNATRRDNGTYICVAENKYYDNSTGRGNVSYDVIVHYVPLVRIEDSSYGKVIEGDVYLASCIVDANPEADIVWSDPYDDIVNNSQTLVITNSAISDAGTYTCHANNTYFNGQIGYGNSSIFVVVQFLAHFTKS
ncbi:kin of IRRE-like protein 1 [Ptychodera flava]|uniref:kin of IRRE-like protein 1 n=1 Tax=Ptychodera flava TaxID=63121 RepID=UPI00396A02CA